MTHAQRARAMGIDPFDYTNHFVITPRNHPIPGRFTDAHEQYPMSDETKDYIANETGLTPSSIVTPYAETQKFVSRVGHTPWSVIKAARESGYDKPKTAGETAAQRLRRAQELEGIYGPDQSKVVHQFPDGWSMRQLNTYGDAVREGELMGNCFSPFTTDWPHMMWESHPQAEWDGRDPDEARYDGEIPDLSAVSEYHHPMPWPTYSLRDPNNLPHVTADPQDQSGNGILGRHNTDVKTEHYPYLYEWMTQTKDPEAAAYAEDFSPEAAKDAERYDQHIKENWTPSGINLGKVADYWHSAPTEDRARIQQYGLQPSNPGVSQRWEKTPLKGMGQPTGVYTVDDPTNAFMWGAPPKHDVWRVREHQVRDATPDPLTEGQVIRHPVPKPELAVKGPETSDYGWYPTPDEEQRQIDNIHEMMEYGNQLGMATLGASGSRASIVAHYPHTSSHQRSPTKLLM